MYTIYAKGNDNKEDELQSVKYLSIGEWLRFLEHTGLLEVNQISIFGAKCIFKWSRIRSIRDLSVKSEMRLRNLYFEDFLVSASCSRERRPASECAAAAAAAAAATAAAAAAAAAAAYTKDGAEPHP